MCKYQNEKRSYEDNLIGIYQDSFRNNAELPALSQFASDRRFTYLDMAEKIARRHILFRLLEIKPGERIALCGGNSASWVIEFMSIITYGATVVPILSDFIAKDIVNIVNHSCSEMLFVDASIWAKLPKEEVKVKAVLTIGDCQLQQSLREDFVIEGLSRVESEFAKLYPQGFRKEDIKYTLPPREDVMILNYTSGTTGFSKGVMLTGVNMAGNVVFGINERVHWRGSRVLSFLPLAHAYGCTFDMLLPLAAGSHMVVLGKTPTPTILLKAFAQVKPNIILSVPLVFEKIYASKIEPKLKGKLMKTLLHIPGISHLIYKKIRKTLTDALGGEFFEVIIGGASFNEQTERFLRKIKFPYTVGFGMTECGPLISYTDWRYYKPTSCGKTLPIMESKVLSKDPEHVPGEILVRGQDVMKGYFHNQEATEAVLDAEGWLHTGDMGTRDADGTLYIRGRCKTMILTASGQNIYPEELEARLNSLAEIMESLVVERGGKLVALVYPDQEWMEKNHVKEEKLPELMTKLRAEVNSRLAPYERLADIEIMKEEFQKTPKRSIKRFLYT